MEWVSNLGHVGRARHKIWLARLAKQLNSQAVTKRDHIKLMKLLGI